MNRAFSVATACSLALLGPRIGSAQHVVHPDVGPTRIAFTTDSVTQSIDLRGAILEIHARIDSTHKATGQYLVRRTWPYETKIIAADTAELHLESPSISFISDGDPSVVLLASYTGGYGSQGIPDFAFKLIVISDSISRAYTFENYDPDTPFYSANVVGFARGPAGSFTIHFEGGTVISYSHDIASWSRPARH